MLLKPELYPPYTPRALASGRFRSQIVRGRGAPERLTVPDLDEGVVHRGAGGGVQDSKIHEKLDSPIAATVRVERPCAWKGAYSCVSLMS